MMTKRREWPKIQSPMEVNLKNSFVSNNYSNASHSLPNSYTHARIHSHTRTYTHTRVHTLTHAYIHSHTRTYTHTRVHTLTHARAYTHTRARIHSHTRTYTHTRARIHSHTRTWHQYRNAVWYNQQSFLCFVRNQTLQIMLMIIPHFHAMETLNL